MFIDIGFYVSIFQLFAVFYEYVLTHITLI
jgi:hypothetical protein